VLLPTAVFAGLALAVHPGGSSTPSTGGAPGMSVRILVTACILLPGPLAADVPCVTEFQTLHFIAIVTGGAAPYLYLWSFGDGTLPGFGDPVNHTFAQCGIYSVGVEVLSPSGMASNVSATALCG